MTSKYPGDRNVPKYNLWGGLKHCMGAWTNSASQFYIHHEFLSLCACSDSNSSSIKSRVIMCPITVCQNLQIRCSRLIHTFPFSMVCVHKHMSQIIFLVHVLGSKTLIFTDCQNIDTATTNKIWVVFFNSLLTDIVLMGLFSFVPGVVSS